MLQVFAFALIVSLIPSLVYARLGGDEEFVKRHPKTKTALHYIHHFMLGLGLMLLSSVAFWMGFQTDGCNALLGFGTGLALDDLLFHVFENYFKRKMNGNGSNTDTRSSA